MRLVVNKTNNDVVCIDDILADKVYAFKDGEYFYKLHRISDNKFTFIALDDSKSWASGFHGSLEDAIKYNIHKNIYEFDNEIGLANFIMEYS